MCEQTALAYDSHVALERKSAPGVLRQDASREQEKLRGVNTDDKPHVGFSIRRGGISRFLSVIRSGQESIYHHQEVDTPERRLSPAAVSLHYNVHTSQHRSQSSPASGASPVNNVAAEATGSC